MDRTYVSTGGVWHAQSDVWFRALCGRRIDKPYRVERDRLGDGRVCKACARVEFAATDIEEPKVEDAFEPFGAPI